MESTFRRQHAAMLLTYSGISFISGAVNHGFFSGERSLWTAAAGIVLFVVGVLLGRTAADADRQSLWTALFWGSLLSIGLGFFTGGLQHFPDSPGRSAWVVPLGFAISAGALFVQQRSAQVSVLSRGAAAYVVAAGLVVTAASVGGWQWMQGHDIASDHHHDAAQDTLVAQVVTRVIDVQLSDEMRFLPGAIEARAGETLRIVARNVGKVDHELVIGTHEDIRDHAASMRAGTSHSHGAGPAIKVAPGATGEIVVTFAKPAVLTMACLLPGHFEAGMRGSVTVAAADQPLGDRPGVAPSTQGKKAAGAHGTHKH